MAGRQAQGSGGVRVGVTPWRDGATCDGDTFARQAERAEDLGFDSFWLPEHHFSGPAAIPAPLLLLAAAAARTERIRIGTTSFLLPVRHPIHVAEEVAVLDRMSGGRVILGVGRGFRGSLFAAFDVPVSEKRDRFEACLAVMRDAWAGKPVAFETGRDGESSPVHVSPRPIQEPHPPVWVAAFGPKAVAQAGRLGLPYLASPMEPLTSLVENCRRHVECLPEGLRDAPRAVPVMRTVFTSEDDVRLARAHAALERQSSVLARAPVAALRRASEVEVGDWALVGRPDEIAEGVRRYREQLGLTHLIVRANVPGLEPDEIEDSLATLAELDLSH